MTTLLGQGRFRYEVAGDWGKLPDGWELSSSESTPATTAAPR